MDEVDDDLKDGGWLKGLSDGKGWLGGRLKPSSRAARFSCLIKLVVDDDDQDDRDDGEGDDGEDDRDGDDDEDDGEGDDDEDDRDGDDDEDGDFHHLRLAPALGPVE